MNAAVAVDRIAETSPRCKARMAGFFYLLMGPGGKTRRLELMAHAQS